MSKIKKYNVTTQISRLFGENYKKHIQVGKKFWWLFDGNSQVFKLTNQHWNKLEITYIRSGVVFYTIENIDSEYYFEIESIMAMGLEPEFLDPQKELGATIERLEMFYFNSERTQIINFENNEYYG